MGQRNACHPSLRPVDVDPVTGTDDVAEVDAGSADTEETQKAEQQPTAENSAATSSESDTDESNAAGAENPADIPSEAVRNTDQLHHQIVLGFRTCVAGHQDLHLRIRP